MRRLLLIGGLAVVLVGGLALYAGIVLREAQRRTQALADELDRCADRLRDLDARFPAPRGDTLDAARFDGCLRARAAAADALGEGENRGAFATLRARNEALRGLADALERERMGLAEYRAVTRRWQSVLARGEPAALLQAWRSMAARLGLRLPPPAGDATPDEGALVASRAATLEAGLGADRLEPVLAGIAEGR